MVAKIEIYAKPATLWRYRALSKLISDDGSERDRLREEVQAVRDGFIWNSPYGRMNDPMEGLYERQETRFSNTSIERDLADRMFGEKSGLGIASLSETWDNELMWAHYADAFRGICVGYNLTRLLAGLPDGTALSRRYRAAVLTSPAPYPDGPPRNPTTPALNRTPATTILSLAQACRRRPEPVAQGGKAMSGFDFRPDVQDELLRLLFDKHRINLLKVPRQDLDPGQMFLVPGAADGVPVAYGPMALARVVPGAVAPRATRDARLADVEGASSRSAETRAEAGICAKLLAMFWPGASLPGISAKVEATGATTLYCRFSEATRDGIDVTKIGTALGTRPADLSFVKDGDAFRLYVITDVYRCSKIEMTWTDAKGNVVDSKVAMDELARFEAGRGSRSSTGGKVSVEGSAALAFGVRLLELVRREDGPGLVVRLEHTRLDVLGGEESRGDGRRMADDADYALLADPWAGELGVELLAPPAS